MMLQIDKRSFDAPDEIRDAGTGKGEVVHVGDVSLMRITLPVGWKWSRHVKPLTRTRSCQAQHLQYVVSGRVRVAMDDGVEMEYGPGDVALIPPGHDAWVIGATPFVAIDVATSDECAGGTHPNHDGTRSYMLRAR